MFRLSEQGIQSDILTRSQHFLVQYRVENSGQGDVIIIDDEKVRMQKAPLSRLFTTGS